MPYPLDLPAIAQFMDEVHMERTMPDYPKHLIGWLNYHDDLRDMITAAIRRADQP